MAEMYNRVIELYQYGSGRVYGRGRRGDSHMGVEGRLWFPHHLEYCFHCIHVHGLVLQSDRIIGPDTL